MQSLMTRRVNAFEQGRLQGAQSSLRGIAFMIGPVLFTTTFGASIGPQYEWRLPGAPYLLAALMLMAAALIAWRATRRSGEPSPALAVAAEQA